jgi:hypothetical protein
MPDSTSKATIRELLKKQRELEAADFSFKTGLEGLYVVGELMEKLRELSDRQVGQLVVDVVWGELPMTSPAMTVSTEAAHRLFRSPGGPSIGEKRLNDPLDLLPCPKCGEPTMIFVGIDEPDCRKCASLKCGHEEVVPETEPEGEE